MLDSVGPDGDRDLVNRSAGDLLPHYGENSLSPPPVAFYYTLQLGPPIRRHAETLDDDVADLVHAVVRTQTPIDPDWMRHRAVSRPRAGFAGELAGDDYPIRFGPATDHPQTTTALGVLQQPLTIGEYDEILE